MAAAAAADQQYYQNYADNFRLSVCSVGCRRGLQRSLQASKGAALLGLVVSELHCLLQGFDANTSGAFHGELPYVAFREQAVLCLVAVSTKAGH